MDLRIEENKEAEVEAALQKIADSEDALIMSFIAPEKGVRRSPIAMDFASITIDDLYTFETKIEEIREKASLPDKLILVIHTPGGLAYAATKIAKYLQSTFKNGIEAYVPYEASSGGTVLCLAAKSIVMDEVSNLTPIDPQVPYKDGRISSASYQQAIRDFKKQYGKLRPTEIESPYQQMAALFDPIIEKQMKKIVSDAMRTAFSLMRNAQSATDPQQIDTLLDTAISLVDTPYPHSHVIDKREAIELHLPISQDNAKMEALRVFKKWVRIKFEDGKANHVIEYTLPKKYERGTTNDSTPEQLSAGEEPAPEQNTNG